MNVSSSVVEEPSLPTVFLDDLYPDPILPHRSHETYMDVLVCWGAKKGVANTGSHSNRKLDVNISVVYSDAVFSKMLVLAESRQPGRFPFTFVLS